MHNICTTSARRLRRWSNIVQMLYRCFAFTGIPLLLIPQNEREKIYNFEVRQPWMDDSRVNSQVKVAAIPWCQVWKPGAVMNGAVPISGARAASGSNFWILLARRCRDLAAARRSPRFVFFSRRLSSVQKRNTRPARSICASNELRCRRNPECLVVLWERSPERLAEDEV